MLIIKREFDIEFFEEVFAFDEPEDTNPVIVKFYRVASCCFAASCDNYSLVAKINEANKEAVRLDKPILEYWKVENGKPVFVRREE